MFFLALISAMPDFYLKLKNSDKMLSVRQGMVIASDFYSPLLLEFSPLENGDMYFKDQISGKKLAITNNKIALQDPIVGFPSALAMVNNGESYFYIKNKDSCLEAETLPLSYKQTKLQFTDCKKADNQLWEPFVVGNKKTELRHIVIPNKNSHLQKHNHIFYPDSKRLIKKHSAFMIYHPEQKFNQSIPKYKDITLNVSESYEPIK